MERALRTRHGPSADTRSGPNPSSGRDLTDAVFTDVTDGEEGSYRGKYDAGQASPSFAIIMAVSNVTELDPLELDPLYESLDTDALDALFTAERSSVDRLTFRHCDCDITIGTDHVVEVVSAGE